MRFIKGRLPASCFETCRSIERVDETAFTTHKSVLISQVNHLDFISRLSPPPPADCSEFRVIHPVQDGSSLVLGLGLVAGVVIVSVIIVCIIVVLCR